VAELPVAVAAPREDVTAVRQAQRMAVACCHGEDAAVARRSYRIRCRLHRLVRRPGRPADVPSPGEECSVAEENRGVGATGPDLENSGEPGDGRGKARRCARRVPELPVVVVSPRDNGSVALERDGMVLARSDRDHAADSGDLLRNERVAAAPTE